MPDVGLGSAFAWTLAGHSLAGWGIRSNEAAPQIPWPAVLDARRPIVWDDSTTVGGGGDAAWLGPDATLASTQATHHDTKDVRARSVFRAESGDFGLNRYSLSFERGSATRWIRYEASSGRRDPYGPVGISGDHVWDLSASLTRGDHHFYGRIGQRGVARQLAHADVSEDASGQSGGARYEWSRGARSVSIQFDRGLDHRIDIIDVGGLALSYSRREGQENRIEAGAGLPLGAGRIEARGLLSDASVIRTYDDAFRAHQKMWWGALQYERPTDEGTWNLGVGAGRMGALEQNVVAPSAGVRFGSASAHGHAYVERMVHPVWSDLALGQAAFLQRTDVVGLEAGGHVRGLRAETGVLVGSTRDRALVFPYPIEDIWLRAGISAESERYDFALLTLGATGGGGPVLFGASGFALGRDQATSEPRVEPDYAARAYLEDGFRIFKNDLGVRLRVEGAGIGERESKTGAIQEETLPAFWTASAIAVLTLSDVTATLRFANLEDQHVPQPWIDPGTGRLARGPGRAFRFTFTWRLLN